MGMQRQWQWLGCGGVVAASLAIATLPFSGGRAIQLSDGTVYFAQVPRLERTRTTHRGVGAFGATYYFTLSIPPNAGEPLQEVTFAQETGVDRVEFLLDRTRAYRGNRRQDSVTLGAVTADDQGMVSARFEPPIQPGERVTIGLYPEHNPSTGGAYLFRVTAFPEGEKSYGQFLGFGRLRFIETGGGGRG